MTTAINTSPLPGSLIDTPTLIAPVVEGVAVTLTTKAGISTPFPAAADTDTARGAALELALAAQVADCAIKLGPGVFRLTDNISLTANGVTLTGSGPSTVLDSRTNAVPGMVINLYADNLTVCDLNWRALAQGVGYATLDPFFPPGHAAENFTLRNIVGDGKGDQLMLWPDATAFTGRLENVVLNGSDSADPTVDLVGTSAASLVFDNVTITSPEGASASILFSGDGNLLFKDSSATGTGVFDLATDGDATITVQNSVYDAALTLGNIVRAKTLGVETGATGVALLTAETPADARTEISAQPLDAELTALASVTSAANTVPYFTGAGTATTTAFSSLGRTVAGVADAAALRNAGGASSGRYPVATLEAPSIISERTVAGAFNPADATTYTGGTTTSGWVATTELALRGIVMPRAGKLRAFAIHMEAVGTLGTGETSSLYIRKNGTTDTLVSSAITTNTSGGARFTSADVGITVAAGDTIQLKWVTPTWTTNPTTVFSAWSVEFVPE